MTHRRPFRVMPRVTHTTPLGWAYLRWGRRIWRVPSLDRGIQPIFPSDDLPWVSWREIAVLSLALWVLLIVAVMTLVDGVRSMWS